MKNKQRPRRCKNLYRLHRFPMFQRVVIGDVMYKECIRCGIREFVCNISEL